MFLNRSDAGKKLAKKLTGYKTKNPIVLAIPRGGVVIGYEVASVLDCEFSVIVARKLGYLRNPEAAFGAVAEDGSVILQPLSKKRLGKMEIETVLKIEKEEIERRKKAYRGKRELPNLTNRVVIIVDDGIATGSTLIVAIEMCQKQKPKELVVATPVSGDGMKRKLSQKVDNVIILETPIDFRAVSQVYEVFDQVGDNEVYKLFEMYRILRTLKKNLDYN
ncbi:MAG: phosphoribosyltransferase [Bacteroidetes bacterium]|jgi:predicted phosphoribosyltransferase|nr:phosphoribosyltransferase [Bacteroidota bacterium]